MVHTDNLISNGEVQWGAVAGLFVSSLVFAWYDLVLSTFNTALTVASRIVGGLLSGPSTVAVRILGLATDTIRISFQTAAARLEALGLGPVSVIVAMAIIAGTWWLSEQLLDRAGGGQ